MKYVTNVCLVWYLNLAKQVISFMSDTEKYPKGSVVLATGSSRPALSFPVLQDGAAGPSGAAPCSADRTGAACRDDWMRWDACEAS